MDGVASTRAVVLNPVGKQGVKSIPGREIQTAIVKPGINNEGGFSVHLNEKANTTTITTKNLLLVSKLMHVTKIQGNKGLRTRDILSNV